MAFKRYIISNTTGMPHLKIGHYKWRPRSLLYPSRRQFVRRLLSSSVFQTENVEKNEQHILYATHV
jgi:hypothetical protein